MNHPTPQTCLDIQEKLPAFLDNELEAHQAQEIEAHCSQCQECHTILEQIPSCWEALGDWEAPSFEDTSLRRSIWQTIEKEKRTEGKVVELKPKGSTSTPKWSWLVAAASLIFFMGIFLGNQIPGDAGKQEYDRHLNQHIASQISGADVQLVTDEALETMPLNSLSHYGKEPRSSFTSKSYRVVPVYNNGEFQAELL